MMAPAAGFYATPGLGAREVRLAYVLEQSKLLLAIEVLKAALIAYPGKIELSEEVSTAHGS